MNYKDALACLEEMEVHGIVLGLDRVRRLLHALGDPHRRFRSVHIAGTNGKGSTAAYTASVLREAGMRTGLYTSPHLHRFTERITLSGKEIFPGDVARQMERILSVIRSAGPDFTPTYFEVTTAMAFAYFGEQNVDFAVVEAGLGGRLDATNVLDPELSVITNVAVEHTEYLGNSLEEIAREKGGIIKKGVDVVTAVREPAALTVLEKICGRSGSRLIRAGREITARSVVRDRSGGGWIFTYRGEEHEWKDLTVPLLGAYQVENAVLAMGVIEGLLRRGVEIPEAAVRAGLSAARWPGRMEVISKDPFVIVDGAHNPHAAEALRRTLREDLTYRRLILVMGVLRDKDIPAVVTPLLFEADCLIFTRPDYFRAADPHALAGKVDGGDLDLRVTDTIADAVDLALSLYETGDLILVTGSLYTVGEARGYLLEKMGQAS